MSEPDTFAGDMFAGGGGGAFDVRTYLWTARKLWWLIAACLGGGVAAGLWLAKMEKPVYVSTAEIKVERRASSSAISLTGFPQPAEGATTPEDLKTIEKSFASPTLMGRVATRLQAGDTTDLAIDGEPVGSLPPDLLATLLLRDCTVALIPDTRLIQVSFRNANPATAQRINALIVEEGIQHDLDQRIAASGESIRYLKEEVKKFEENLRASEEKLNAYTRTLGNVSIDNDLNIVANQLRELNSRGTVAKAERIRLENEYAQVQARIGNAARLLEIESIQRMPAIVNLSNQISELRAKIAKLELRYRDENPFMRQARSELAELEQALEREILAAPRTIESALANARRSEEAIVREQKLQEEKVIQVRDLAVPSRVLQRQIDADRLALEAALKRLTEELSQARSQPVLLQVVNRASYGVPAPSKKMKTLAMAAFLGALAGAGLVFLVMQLDTTLKSGDAAARFLGLPLLATIPEHEDADPAAAPDSRPACPAFDKPLAPVAEAFRSLRAALRGGDELKSARAILLCAPTAGDGATFSAMNLATVFAQAGQRTLLIDANLRDPGIGAPLLERPPHVGLSEFLQREAGLANAIAPSRQALLDVIVAGGPCSLPSELLSRERFGGLLTEAAPIYDRIVVDSAAIGAFSDTLGFAKLFPAVCMVIASGKTPRDLARRSLEQLRQAGARVTGIVFNERKQRRGKAARDTERATPRPEPPPLVVCPACGRSFDTFARFLARTAPDPASNGAGGPESPVHRLCGCGASLTARASELRDTSREGIRRRLVFGELLEALEAAGMSPHEARQYLLLNLKIWSNELPDEAGMDGSQAALERARLLSELAGKLAGAGLTPQQARAKLDAALDAWRMHAR